MPALVSLKLWASLTSIATVGPHYVYVFGIQASAHYRQKLATIALPHVHWVVAVDPRHPLAWRMGCVCEYARHEERLQLQLQEQIQ